MAIEILRPTSNYSSADCSNPAYAYDGDLSTAMIVFSYSGIPSNQFNYCMGFQTPSKTWLTAGVLKCKNSGQLIAAPGTNGIQSYVGGSWVDWHRNTTWGPVTDTRAITQAQAASTVYVLSTAEWNGSGSAYVFNYEAWIEGPYLLDVAPGSPGCTAGFRQNTLTWGSVSGASSYNGYWTNDGSTPTIASNVLTGITSGYVHTGLTEGLQYKYKFAGVDAQGVGVLSTQVDGTPYGGGIPFQPVTLF